MGGFTYTSHVQAVITMLDSQVDLNVKKACVYMVNKLKQALTGMRHGRVYRVYGTGRVYVASAPGEAPAVRTGRLRNSIKCYFQGSGMSIKGVIGTDLDYAVFLETGTSKMNARPYFLITFEKERLTILKMLREGTG